MMRGRWWMRGLCASACVAFGVSACDEDPPAGPTTGSVQITAATTGTDLDADGYTVAIDGGAGVAIDINGSVTIPGVTPGNRSVELTGLADNCSVTGSNPAATSVTAGDTAQVAFSVTCAAPPTGTVVVTTATTGDTLDPDGYSVEIDGTSTAVGINDTVTIGDLAAGTYAVTLSDIADNCSLSDTTAMSVTLAGGDTANVDFGVTCTAPLPTGTVVVTTATTGDTLDPDGYTIDIGTSSTPAGINDTVSIDLDAGSYVATLGGVASNCMPTDTAGVAFTLAGNDTANVAFTVACTAPAGVSASEWIAFTTDRDGNDEVYLTPPDSSAPINLTNAVGMDGQAAFSPDSTKIAFRTDRDGNGEIYVINADGTGLTNLSADSADDRSPTWSPDGTQIAFVTDRDGNDEIYLMNADGTGLTNLSNDSTGADIDPAWAPSGSQLAFSTDRDGQSEIYVINSDGTGATNVSADTTGADTQPAWSPDGTTIAFTTDRDGNSEVYTMASDGSGATNLTNDAGADSGAAWSPDGMRIAFATDRDGNGEVYVMASDGSGAVNITNDAGNDREPAWGVAKR